MSKESNTAMDFAAAFNAAQHALARRNLVGGTWPLFELLRDPTREPMKVVNTFLEPILKDAIAKQKASQGFLDTEKGAEGETLLDHLIRQTTGAYYHHYYNFTTERRDTLDINVLRDQTLNILLAGRDTVCIPYHYVGRRNLIHPRLPQP